MTDRPKSSGSVRPDEHARRVLPADLVDAFVRLAKGDFTVRLTRNLKRDTDDALAFFVNVIAEQLERLTSERERVHAELSAGVDRLALQFRALAAGEFDVRAERTGRGDVVDTLGRMFNDMAAEVGAVFDDHERQRAVLEATLESMVDGVLLLGPGAVIQRANGAMARLLGLTPSALAGLPIATILAEREQAFAETLVELERMTPFRSRDTVFRTASGEDVTMAVNGSPQRGADGALLGIVLVARDDRELKAAQSQLQVADRLATMGTVVAGVAHEIKNPLAFVMSNLQFLEEELASLRDTGRLSSARIDEAVRALSGSRGGAQRIKQIVGELRTFSRTEAVASSAVEVNAVVDAAHALIQHELRHHARFSKELGPTPVVRADEGRLVQVFVNLLQNAAQAIPIGDVDRHLVRLVTGTTEGGAAFVEVHDSGCGIAPEQMAHLFDLFYTTKPVGFGTGPGLSICHRIVESLGGRIEVESTLGRGTMFRVTLPAAVSGTTAPRARPSPGAVERPRLRVLVIDDEREIVESVRRLLRDHDVDAATSPTEALVLARDRPYDAILCDLLMPEMTGLELHARLSSTHPELARRVVFMTGGTSGATAQELFEGLPNERIDKPFDADELLPLLERARRR